MRKRHREVRGQRAIHVSVDGETATLQFPNGATLAKVPLRDLGLPQNQWVKKLEIAPLQHVGFFALLKKQADMHERSQGLPKQPLACFLTPVALELVHTIALSSTEAT